MKTNWPIKILQRRQGKLLGAQFFIFLLKTIRDFDAFLSTAIRSHILAPSLNRFVAKMLFEDDYF